MLRYPSMGPINILSILDSNSDLGPSPPSPYILAISFPTIALMAHVNRIMIFPLILLVRIKLPLLHASQALLPVESRPPTTPSWPPMHETSAFWVYANGAVSPPELSTLQRYLDCSAQQPPQFWEVVDCRYRLRHQGHRHRSGFRQRLTTRKRMRVSIELCRLVIDCPL